MMRAALALTAATTAVTGFAAPAHPMLRPVAAPAPVVAPAGGAAEAAEVAPRRAAAGRPARAGVVRPRRVAPPVRLVVPPHSHAPGEGAHDHLPVAAPGPRPANPVRWDGRAFPTPEAAMRFLVRAYNALDDRALAHVTTPDARTELVAMRHDLAPELRLRSCTRLESGAYECTFTHSTPRSEKHTGTALFRVAPAARPGWYMTVLEECG